jgi:DNA-binding SARP family transcriptional activator
VASANTSRLEIRLLGRPEICREGRPLPPLATRETLSPLAFLALHTAQPHSRDELATLLWLFRRQRGL